MKDWFDSLEERESIIVTAGAVVIIFAVAWFGLWVPLSDSHTGVTARVDDWKRSLAQLRPMRGQIQASANSQPAALVQNQSLVVIIDSSLRQRGLTPALQRSQPTPSGTGIRVEFEGAAFDDLMLWLGDIHLQYGLQVESGSFSVASSGSPGRVNSSITLQL